MDALKGIQIDTEIIPEGCLSCVEEASYITSVVEEDFNALMEEAGECEEDDDDFTNESVVLTEGKLNEIGNKIIVALQKAWGAIKKVFNDLINWIKEKVAEFKKKNLEKTLDKVIKEDKLKPDAKLGKYHKGENISNTAWIKIIKVNAAFGNQHGGGTNDEIESLPKIVANVCGGNKTEDIDLSEMKKVMKEYFLGEEVEVTGANFKKDTFANILKGSQLSDVKKAYNEVRAYINDAIRAVKGWSKTGETTKAGDDIYTYNKDDKAEGESYGKKIKWLKRCVQILSQGNGVQCDAIRQQNREALAVVMAASRKGNKKTDSKKEAAIFAW